MPDIVFFLALRMENPRKNTESKIAALLGVSIQTISVWLQTNTNVGNSLLLDARVKVPPKARLSGWELLPTLAIVPCWMPESKCLQRQGCLVGN